MPTRLALLRDEVRYKPDSSEAYFELGFEYFRLRNYTDAAINYKRVLLSRGSDAECWNNYGVALYRTKRGDKAREALQRAGDLAPDQGVIQYNLGVVVDSQGRLADAVVAYARASAAARKGGKKKLESKARDARGFCLERLEKLDDAAHEYDLAFQLDSENFNAKEDHALGQAMLRRRHLESLCKQLGKTDIAELPRSDAEKQQDAKDAKLCDPKALEMRSQLRLDVFDEQLRQVPKPPPPPPSEPGPTLTLSLEALQQPWRPSGESVWLNGTGSRYLPPCKRVPKREVPSLVPRWRKLKQIQNAAQAFGDDRVDGGGEYVPPRPAYLDPIGDVPRKKPVYYIRDRPNVTLDPKVVVHRSAVRNALSTVGFDSTKLAQLGNHGPRLCWELTPRNRLRYRIPPDGTEPEEDWEVTLAERNPWRNP